MQTDFILLNSKVTGDIPYLMLTTPTSKFTIYGSLDAEGKNPLLAAGSVLWRGDGTVDLVHFDYIIPYLDNESLKILYKGIGDIIKRIEPLKYEQ